METTSDSLIEFRAALERTYLQACEIPDLEQRGIQKLLYRALNTLDDLLEKDHDKG